MERVAVVGTGALGSVHARVLAGLPGATLAGVVDDDPARAGEVAARHGCPVLPGLEALRGVADAAIVAVPTRAHFEVASTLLAMGIPCLVEKPLAATAEEGRRLVALARARGLPLMVGHVERFNPVVAALLERPIAPRFVEAQRVSPFAFRSTDVGVVLDMMIHDIDIILHLVDSPVRALHAVGVGVIGDHEDLANVRILFENGAVANVTASRLALKKERTLRVFSKDLYASLDLLERKGRIVRPGPRLKEGLAAGTLDLGGMSPLEAMLQNLVQVEDLAAGEGEPLALEDAEFLAAVREGRDPAVTGEHGLRAMEVARQVVDAIRENLAREAGGGR